MGGVREHRRNTRVAPVTVLHGRGGGAAGVVPSGGAGAPRGAIRLVGVRRGLRGGRGATPPGDRDRGRDGDGRWRGRGPAVAGDCRGNWRDGGDCGGRCGGLGLHVPKAPEGWVLGACAIADGNEPRMRAGARPTHRAAGAHHPSRKRYRPPVPVACRRSPARVPVGPRRKRGAGAGTPMSLPTAAAAPGLVMVRGGGLGAGATEHPHAGRDTRRVPRATGRRRCIRMGRGAVLARWERDSDDARTGERDRRQGRAAHRPRPVGDHRRRAPVRRHRRRPRRPGRAYHGPAGRRRDHHRTGGTAEPVAVRRGPHHRAHRLRRRRQEPAGLIVDAAKDPRRASRSSCTRRGQAMVTDLRKTGAELFEAQELKNRDLPEFVRGEFASHRLRVSLTW